MSLHELLGWDRPASAAPEPARPADAARPKGVPAQPAPPPVAQRPAAPAKASHSPPNAPSQAASQRPADGAASSPYDAPGHAHTGHERAAEDDALDDDGEESAADAPHHGPRLAIVDGSNVAHAGLGHGARLANVLVVRDKLVEEGYEPVIVVDAALRHQIDDVAGYEALVDSGVVKQAPAGTDADYFILAFARELGAAIVSNDQFRDRSQQFAAVRRQIIRYMVVADEVVFEKRTARRRP